MNGKFFSENMYQTQTKFSFSDESNLDFYLPFKMSLQSINIACSNHELAIIWRKFNDIPKSWNQILYIPVTINFLFTSIQILKWCRNTHIVYVSFNKIFTLQISVILILFTLQIISIIVFSLSLWDKHKKK